METLKRRVEKAEEEAKKALEMTPEDWRKIKLTFFRLRGIVHYLVARLPGFTPATYPQEDVDEMIKEVLEQVEGGVDCDMTDENIEVMTTLRSQQLCSELLYGARKAYKEAQKQSSKNGVDGVDGEAYDEAVEKYLESKVEELEREEASDAELERLFGPEEMSDESEELDESAGGVGTPVEGEEPGDAGAPPLERCPKCGHGFPMYDSFIGATVCSSCGSPLRRKTT